MCVTDHCSLPCNLEEQPCETMMIKPLVEPLFTYICIRMALKPVSSSLPFCLLNMNRRQEQCSAVHSETVMTPVLPGQITSPDTSAVGPASPVNLISYLHIFDLKEKDQSTNRFVICLTAETNPSCYAAGQRRLLPGPLYRPQTTCFVRTEQHDE